MSQSACPKHFLNHRWSTWNWIHEIEYSSDKASLILIMPALNTPANSRVLPPSVWLSSLTSFSFNLLKGAHLHSWRWSPLSKEGSYSRWPLPLWVSHSPEDWVMAQEIHWLQGHSHLHTCMHTSSLLNHCLHIWWPLHSKLFHMHVDICATHESMFSFLTI